MAETKSTTPDKQLEHKEEGQGAKATSIGCAFIFLISFFMLLYAGIAEEVQWENCRYTYYGEMKVQSLKKKTEMVSANWFSDDLRMHASKVSLTKGKLDKDIATLYVSPKLLKYVIKGQQLNGKIRPLRCATWGDFFKIGYNRYDYCLVDVYAYTDANGVLHKLKKEKFKEDNSAIEWIIGGVVFLILIVNLIVGRMTVPTLKKEEKEWKYDVPSWLEWIRILILLSPTAFLGVHIYELNVAGTLSDHWLMIAILALLDLIPVSMAWRVFSKRKNYIKISSTTIEFNINNKLTCLTIMDYGTVTISGEYHRGSVVDRSFEFDNGSEKVAFKCEELGMKTNEDQLYKVMLHYLGNGGINIVDQTKDK
jgi:hypothetical protein